MSASSTSPDTLITVKVTFEGNTRRFKLALREVGPSVLQGKLRTLLAIPEAADVKFERYSDSAAGWMTLDPQNSAVYKQLYRAAKAKLKLRIKASLVPAEGAPVPEDGASEKPSFPPSYSTTQLNILPPAPSSAASTPTIATAVDAAQLDDAVAKAVTSYCSSSEFTSQLRDTVREEVEKQQPEPEQPADQTVPEPASKPSAEADDDPLGVFLRGCVAIYCNKCDCAIQGLHYHCDECDDGDYDLCEACTAKGVHCYDGSHWLSHREIVAGKPVVREPSSKPAANHRICNCCLGRFPDELCVFCLDCKDFDLCAPCLRAGGHGHDPRHAFSPALEGAKSVKDVLPLLSPGRNVRHAALCNECDRNIYGIRHKCIDCPDWDYCADCVASAPETHPGHRLVPVFDNKDVAPLYKTVRHSRVVHSGVYCDGSVCAQFKRGVCIRGVRFKCAICPDTDFCGTCEASPSNEHNPTHPMIRFKTPVRHVLVTSTDETKALMGDVPPTLPAAAAAAAPAQQHASVVAAELEKHKAVAAAAAAAAAAQATATIPTTASASTNTVNPPPGTAAAITTTNTATQVQTIADVKPTEEFAVPVQTKKAEEKQPEQVEEKKEEKEEEPKPQPKAPAVPKPKAKAPAVPKPKAPAAPKPKAPAVPPMDDLYATFVGDSIADGTALTVGQEFTQTWYMKNVGSSAWPTGITVKFCGGDYMFLKSAEDHLNATVTDSEVAPGVTVGFSVGLSATWPPNRSYISYWRLVAPDGRRFGDSLWCNINVTETPSRAHAAIEHVESPKDEDRNSDADSLESVVDVNSVKSVKDDDLESTNGALARSQASSQMVFPKLPVESPVHSLEQLPAAAAVVAAMAPGSKKAKPVLPVPTSPTVTSSSSHKTFALSEDGDVEEEVDVSSIDSEGFMTDEEYDVLCASDEEFEECERI